MSDGSDGLGLVEENVRIARRNRESSERLARQGASKLPTLAEREATKAAAAEVAPSAPPRKRVPVVPGVVVPVQKVHQPPAVAVTRVDAPGFVDPKRRRNGSKAPKIAAGPVLGMRDAILRVVTPGRTEYSADILSIGDAHEAGQALDKSTRAATPRGASMALAARVDLRPEGVRERKLPEDKPAIEAPPVGFAAKAWLNGEPVELPSFIIDGGERFTRVRIQAMILDGKIDRAVVSVGEDRGALQTEYVPKLAPVVQTTSRGVVVPTGNRSTWEGAEETVREDGDPKFRASVGIPRLTGPDGVPFRITRDFATEAQARGFVSDLIGHEGGDDGTIVALGKSPIKLCLDDPSWEADAAMAMTDRQRYVSNLPTPAGDEPVAPRNRDIWVKRYPTPVKGTWMKAKSDTCSFSRG